MKRIKQFHELKEELDTVSEGDSGAFGNSVKYTTVNGELYVSAKDMAEWCSGKTGTTWDIFRKWLFGITNAGG